MPAWMKTRLARLALWWLGTRALAWAAMVAGSFFARGPDKYAFWVGEENGFRFAQVPWRALDVWGRWDTMLYLLIAGSGYPPPSPDGGWVHQAAFFPLFPALIRGASELLGGANHFLVGLALANAAFLAALVYFDRLLRLDASDELAGAAVVALLCYPGSHFFSVVYPESTALLLGVLSFYFLRTGRPGGAFVSAALAAVCRPTGFVVAAVLALEVLRKSRGSPRQLALLAWLLVPLGSVAALLGLHAQVYGDPLYFVRVQAAWNRGVAFPLAGFLDFSLSLDHHLFALGAIALCVVGLRGGHHPMLKAYAALHLLVPLFTGSLRSVHRLAGGDFPLFAFAAKAFEARPWLQRAWVAVGLVVLAVFSFRWGTGAWPN